MNILAVEAHPDDVEFMCAGTLALLATLGHPISILSISAGECGSISMSSEDTIRTRLSEGEKAAAILNGRFYYAQVRDKHLAYIEEQRYRVCEIFRMVKPDLVFALSPKDYILDHDFASLLARDAATAASVHNFRTGMLNPSPPTESIPYLYYCEPIGRADIFGDPVLSTVYVDVTPVMDTKRRMLECHASQREFMRYRFGMENYIETMEKWSAAAGTSAGSKYGEGFRQHVALPFPSDNVLSTLLEARAIAAVP